MVSFKYPPLYATSYGCKPFYSNRWHDSPQTIMTEMITSRAIIQVIEDLAPPKVITREPRPLLVAMEVSIIHGRYTILSDLFGDIETVNRIDGFV